MNERISVRKRKGRWEVWVKGGRWDSDLPAGIWGSWTSAMMHACAIARAMRWANAEVPC
jgi:hypothetical protein